MDIVKSSSRRIFNDMERSLHSLMLNSKFIENIGLLDGKTGIAIAYAEVSKYLSNEVYYDCMSDLLDDILVQANTKLDIGFASGLSGIGWGIEYLIQNNFIECGGKNVLKELDDKIMETNPGRIADKSLEKGFEGLLHYVILHIQGMLKQNIQLSFDSSYLSELYYICNIINKQKALDTGMQSLLDIYCKFYETGTINNYNSIISIFLPAMTEETIPSLTSNQLGLRNGLAGYVLRMVTLKQ